MPLGTRTNARAATCILEHKPDGRKVGRKTHNEVRNWSILCLVLRAQTRNRNRLAGLEQGALWCARGSISDFATLVPKSY
jgi:hypothetical protein